MSNSEKLKAGQDNDWLIYRRLLRYVMKYKFQFMLSIIGFGIFAASAPLLAHMMKVIADVFNNPTLENRLMLVGGVVGIFFLRGLGTFLGTYYISVVGRSTIHDLRTSLFNHLLLLPNAYYDRNSRGHVISKMSYDVEQIYGASTKAITSLAQEGLTVLSLLGYMFYTNWKLTLIFFAVTPFVGVVVTKANGYFKKYSRRIQQTMGDVTQIAGESINGYKEVKTFGGYEYEEARFNKASLQNCVQSVKYSRVNAVSVPVMQFAVAISISIIVWVAMAPSIRGNMDIGLFLSFMAAASTLAKPMRTLADINSLVQRGITAAESVFSVLDEDPEDDKGSVSIEKSAGDVAFKNVTFRYETSEKDVLSQVSFADTRGKTIALVGKSGSGKSTIISLLGRFYEPVEGEVLLDGLPLQQYKLRDLRNQIAMVSQNVTLFNDTIFNNIAYGSLKHKSREEVLAAAKAAHALEFIDTLPNGIDTMIGDNGVMLSGGQRQRLAIARAILKNAPILILDEATSALDTESERYIQDALEKFMQGRTTFVVAHRLSTIEKADMIMVVHEGKIVEQGGHQDLLAQGGMYKTLHSMQFSGM